MNENSFDLKSLVFPLLGVGALFFLEGSNNDLNDCTCVHDSDSESEFDDHKNDFEPEESPSEVTEPALKVVTEDAASNPSTEAV